MGQEGTVARKKGGRDYQVGKPADASTRSDQAPSRAGPCRQMPQGTSTSHCQGATPSSEPHPCVVVGRPSAPMPCAHGSVRPQRARLYRCLMLSVPGLYTVSVQQAKRQQSSRSPPRLLPQPNSWHVSARPGFLASPSLKAACPPTESHLPGSPTPAPGAEWEVNRGMDVTCQSCLLVSWFASPCLCSYPSSRVFERRGSSCRGRILSPRHRHSPCARPFPRGRARERATCATYNS